MKLKHEGPQYVKSNINARSENTFRVYKENHD